MPVKGGAYIAGVRIWEVGALLFFFPIHVQPKFRSHSHRNCLMIVGFFQESIFDVPYNKNNS